MYIYKTGPKWKLTLGALITYMLKWTFLTFWLDWAYISQRILLGWYKIDWNQSKTSIVSEGLNWISTQNLKFMKKDRHRSTIFAVNICQKWESLIWNDLKLVLSFCQWFFLLMSTNWDTEVKNPPSPLFVINVHSKFETVLYAETPVAQIWTILGASLGRYSDCKVCL